MAALTGLTVGDEPGDWAALGFAVEDGHVTVGGVRVTLSGDGTGLRRWALDDVALDGDRLDGLRTDRQPPPATGPTHPNGIVEVDHVVVASPDLERTIAAFGAAGLELRRVRDTGTYGTPMKQAFFKPAGGIIELIGPAEKQGDGGSRFFGIAFTSADLDATAAFLGDRLKPAKDAVQPGRRIATLRTGVGAGVPIAIMSPEPTDGGDPL